MNARNDNSPPRIGRQWILGKGTSVAHIQDKGGFDAVMLLVLEDGLVVGQKLLHPREPLELGTFLEGVMDNPNMGVPREPASYLVEDPELEQALLDAFPNVPVDIGPTPEVQAIMEAFDEEYAPKTEGSYLKNGAIDARVMHEFFTAAREFYLTAPWEGVGDMDLVRVDIKEAGIEGACLTILGSGGIKTGLFLYLSYEKFADFMEIAQIASDGELDVPDVQEKMSIALNYEKAPNLPTRSRKEALKHQWPVANPEAYPVFAYVMNDFSMLELSEAEVSLLALVMVGFTAFYKECGAGWAEGSAASVVAVGELNVEFTYPYEAYGELEND